jgi:hypothetical protein
MNFQLKFAKTALITLGLLCCFSFAQTSAALDSIEENVIGFALNGQAKAGILSSTLSSEALPEDAVSEYLAFTDFLLSLSVRPSNETKATFDLRFHKDWQEAYREGNNSPLVRWWSYDGNILAKKLKFNLGTMRVAYTPLTIYLPEPNLIMEPEIFASLKKEAMEDRYLDGTNRRLLQGLNLEYRNSAGIFDNIFLQGTLVRLRKAAAAYDRISFDFDPNKDRFSAAARFGVETFGLYAGVNEVYTFNRLGSVSRYRISSDNRNNRLDFEKNNVLSFELNYDSKKLSLKPVSFGVGAEYALSNWTHIRDTIVREPTINLIRDTVSMPSIIAPGGSRNPNNVYLYYRTDNPESYKFNEVESLENKGALFANAFVAFDQKPFEAKLSGHFLNVNEDFEAEMAASPAYLPNLPILNSSAEINSAFAQFRTGSLENMYYSLYYSLPLNAMTVLSGEQGKIGGVLDINYIMNNNYKLNQYYRNAYTQQTYTRLERAAESSRLDPSVNMALPYGYATPDRSGGGADLSFAWNKAVNLKAVFGKYSSEYSDYTRMGGGAEVDIARLAGLGKALEVSGSFEQNKQENGAFDPQVSRIMAGAKVGIWRGLYLIGGFQQLSSEFANPFQIVEGVNVNKTGETLITGGPQVKISEKAKFSLQCSLLSNSVEGNTNDGPVNLDLDKFIMSGIVEVEF